MRDNGIGIDTAHREKIFAVFKRLHSAGKYAGSGIGLAICKKILERAGGRIWVESELGQGSVFYFAWPKQAPRKNGAADFVARVWRMRRSAMRPVANEPISPAPPQSYLGSPAPSLGSLGPSLGSTGPSAACQASNPPCST